MFDVKSEKIKMPFLLVWAFGEHELKLRGYMYILLLCFIPCKEIQNPGNVCLWNPESMRFFL